MKASTILASLSTIALAAALPKPQNSTTNFSFPTVTVQFYQAGVPIEDIKVQVGSLSDIEIAGPDSAKIVAVINDDGTEFAGAENVICAFNQNGASTIAGEVQGLDQEIAFGPQVRRITRTACEI